MNELLIRGGALVNTGQFQKGGEMLLAGLAQDPHNAHGYFQLGCVTHGTEDAQTYFAKALAFSPDDPSYAYFDKLSFSNISNPNSMSKRPSNLATEIETLMDKADLEPIALGILVKIAVDENQLNLAFRCYCDAVKKMNAETKLEGLHALMDTDTSLPWYKALDRMRAALDHPTFHDQDFQLWTSFLGKSDGGRRLAFQSVFLMEFMDLRQRRKDIRLQSQADSIFSIFRLPPLPSRCLGATPMSPTAAEQMDRMITYGH